MADLVVACPQVVMELIRESMTGVLTNEFEELLDIIRRVQPLLLEMRQNPEERAKSCLARLENEIYEADGLLEYCSETVSVRNFFSLTSSNLFVWRHKLRHAIKKIRKLELETGIHDYRAQVETRPVQTIESAREETYPIIRDKKYIIGRDSETEEIIKLVLEAANTNETDQKLRVVPIVGVQGIGKTTLAQFVYNEEVVAQHFEMRMWVCIAGFVDVRLIVQKLIESAKGGEGVVYPQMDRLQRELRKTISGKRFFLVLDDMRHGSRENWLSLRNLLMGGAEGSCVLVTTRSEKVAKITRTVAQPYRLGPLNAAHSWLLLKSKVFSSYGNKLEPEFRGPIEQIGRQIAEKCKGVPLAIWCVGASLHSFRGSVSEWHSFNSDENIAEVLRDKIGFQFEVNDDPEAKAMTGMREQTHSFVPEEEVIGRGADKEAIIKQLFQSEEKELVIAIVGTAGLGKTALAQLIYNDSRIQQHFDLRIWVHVTEIFDMRVIMEKIIVSVMTKEPSNLDEVQLQRLTNQAIQGKRYLLILDDVWNEEDGKWSDLRSLLSVGANGSRVIVTTRSEGVAFVTAGKERTYKLEPLDEYSRWSLFVKVAFEKGQEPSNSKIMEIGKRIVAKCEGIPLAIRTIGGILYFKNTETEWQSFHEKELPKIFTGEGMLASLKLSYDNLPSHLKQCFAYCGLFPQDCEIDVQTLVNLWMSQGFIISPNSDLDLEDVGYNYFVELLRRSFFQETTRDEWGRITKCKMQNLMCNLAKSVDMNGCATLGLKGGINGTEVRHVSFDFHLDSSWHIRLLAQSKRIRSLILPRQIRWEVEGRSSESVCGEVTKFKHLRMLDLHNSGIKFVLDSIGDLKLLRYLDLSQNMNIKALPNSIGRLKKLHTLKLNHCSNLQKLPGAITKLVNLRNLENESCYSLTHMPQGLYQLRYLRTLSEFVLCKGKGSVSNKSGKLDELGYLDELRGKLKIKNLRGLGGDRTARAYLGDKEHLVSLTLIWDINASPDAADCEQLLEDLRPPEYLRELSLSAYGGAKFSNWLPEQKNLIKLSLSRCMNCQCLPQLHHLSRLKVLLVAEMPELEYISEKTSKDESETFFQSLEELQLTNLPKLEGWWKDAAGVQETAFPRLSKLIVEDCPKMISMPLFPCLELLVLSNTSWEPLQQSMRAQQTPSSTHEASSSSTTVAGPIDPLSKLRTLFIINMPHGGPNIWKSLSSLHSLTVDHLPDIETFLKGLHEQVTNLHGSEKKRKTNLQELHIWRCASLKEISWISEIESLRILSLRLCPNLQMQRDSISLITKLQKVEIEECPKISHLERMLEDRSYRE